ncbi:hypothetical protein lpari_00136 [Legionella parisiensis]|uniref:Uncharacterized protein n=1 Tax=Legionella parisiensis TaxID=45071 RepID=A0A1E5JW15_9GAMM|nr:hypothetical protein lpari_00136 [Legionella parisiensis]
MFQSNPWQLQSHESNHNNNLDFVWRERQLLRHSIEYLQKNSVSVFGHPQD